MTLKGTKNPIPQKKQADAEIIAQQSAQIRNLTNQFQQVMTEYKQMGFQLQEYRNMDYRRGHMFQAIDFAIRSLPQQHIIIMDIVMQKANDYQEAIERRVAELVEADKQKRDEQRAAAEAELIAKEKADAENKDKTT